MEKITKNTRLVFMLFYLNLFFLFLFSFFLSKHIFINGLSTAMGIEITVWMAIFSTITIFLMVKFPFLRLKFAKEKNEFVNNLRYAEVALFAFVFILFPNLIIDLLPNGVHELLSFELSIIGSWAGIILIIEIFIIPAARVSQKIRESLEEN